MNIDENQIESAINENTKIIMVMHYAGVSCEMDKILSIARKYNLFLIEDAAQAITSKYNDKYLGTIGDFGCYSFHETKNLSMGEGGALLINDEKYIERAEILREKGTNRSKFFRGEIDKYTWTDFGDSYLPSELNAAYLYGQLVDIDKIQNSRMSNWNYYHEILKPLADTGKIELPFVPANCTHNAHMFYIKTSDLSERLKLIAYLKSNGILAVSHYIPLHSSPAGKRFGRFFGKDIYTTRESERILRLPLYYGLQKEQVKYICNQIYKFYGINK